MSLFSERRRLYQHAPGEHPVSQPNPEALNDSPFVDEFRRLGEFCRELMRNIEDIAHAFLSAGFNEPGSHTGHTAFPRFRAAYGRFRNEARFHQRTTVRQLEGVERLRDVLADVLGDLDGLEFPNTVPPIFADDGLPDVLPPDPGLPSVTPSAIPPAMSPATPPATPPATSPATPSPTKPPEIEVKKPTLTVTTKPPYNVDGQIWVTMDPPTEKLVVLFGDAQYTVGKKDTVDDDTIKIDTPAGNNWIITPKKPGKMHLRTFNGHSEQNLNIEALPAKPTLTVPDRLDIGVPANMSVNPSDTLTIQCETGNPVVTYILTVLPNGALQTDPLNAAIDFDITRDAKTGVITATPRKAGTFTFTVGSLSQKRTIEAAPEADPKEWLKKLTDTWQSAKVIGHTDKHIAFKKTGDSVYALQSAVGIVLKLKAPKYVVDDGMRMDGKAWFNLLVPGWSDKLKTEGVWVPITDLGLDLSAPYMKDTVLSDAPGVAKFKFLKKGGKYYFRGHPTENSIFELTDDERNPLGKPDADALEVETERVVITIDDVSPFPSYIPVPLTIKPNKAAVVCEMSVGDAEYTFTVASDGSITGTVGADVVVTRVEGAMRVLSKNGGSLRIKSQNGKESKFIVFDSPEKPDKPTVPDLQVGKPVQIGFSEYGTLRVLVGETSYEITPGNPPRVDRENPPFSVQAHDDKAIVFMPTAPTNYTFLAVRGGKVSDSVKKEVKEAAPEKSVTISKGPYVVGKEITVNVVPKDALLLIESSAGLGSIDGKGMAGGKSDTFAVVSRRDGVIIFTPKSAGDFSINIKGATVQNITVQEVAPETPSNPVLLNILQNTKLPDGVTAEVRGMMVSLAYNGKIAGIDCEDALKKGRVFAVQAIEAGINSLMIAASGTPERLAAIPTKNFTDGFTFTLGANNISNGKRTYTFANRKAVSVPASNLLLKNLRNEFKADGTLDLNNKQLRIWCLLALGARPEQIDPTKAILGFQFDAASQKLVVVLFDGISPKAVIEIDWKNNTVHSTTRFTYNDTIDERRSGFALDAPDAVANYLKRKAVHALRDSTRTTLGATVKAVNATVDTTGSASSIVVDLKDETRIVFPISHSPDTDVRTDVVLWCNRAVVDEKDFSFSERKPLTAEDIADLVGLYVKNKTFEKKEAAPDAALSKEELEKLASTWGMNVDASLPNTLYSNSNDLLGNRVVGNRITREFGEYFFVQFKSDGSIATIYFASSTGQNPKIPAVIKDLVKDCIGKKMNVDQIKEAKTNILKTLNGKYLDAYAKILSAKSTELGFAIDTYDEGLLFSAIGQHVSNPIVGARAAKALGSYFGIKFDADMKVKAMGFTETNSANIKNPEAITTLVQPYLGKPISRAEIDILMPKIEAFLNTQYLDDFAKKVGTFAREASFALAPLEENAVYSNILSLELIPAKRDAVTREFGEYFFVVFNNDATVKNFGFSQTDTKALKTPPSLNDIFNTRIGKTLSAAEYKIMKAEMKAALEKTVAISEQAPQIKALLESDSDYSIDPNDANTVICDLRCLYGEHIEKYTQVLQAPVVAKIRGEFGISDVILSITLKPDGALQSVGLRDKNGMPVLPAVLQSFPDAYIGKKLTPQEIRAMRTKLIQEFDTKYQDDFGRTFAKQLVQMQEAQRADARDGVVPGNWQWIHFSVSPKERHTMIVDLRPNLGDGAAARIKRESGDGYHFLSVKFKEDMTLDTVLLTNENLQPARVQPPQIQQEVEAAKKKRWDPPALRSMLRSIFGAVRRNYTDE